MGQYYNTLLGLFLVSTSGAMFTKQLNPTNQTELDGRIVGGHYTNIQQFPYQASLWFFGKLHCGCSILDTGDAETTGFFFVTAAHCVIPTFAVYYKIKYATSSVEEMFPMAFIKTMVPHEKYDPNTGDYDIALIKVQQRISFSSKARPIRMASVRPAAGTSAVVTGWGTDREGGDLSSYLQSVTVNVVDTNQCARLYASKGYITERMLCAGVPEGGKDACQGDSGGPLVADGVQIGIVSWGLGCAQRDYPGVYTNVADLNSWISKTVKEL